MWKKISDIYQFPLGEEVFSRGGTAEVKQKKKKKGKILGRWWGKNRD